MKIQTGKEEKMELKLRCFLVFCGILMISQTVSGQSNAKGLESLKKFDYFNAKKTFQKNIEDQPFTSSFGLAAIFNQTDNPFSNLDSARIYLADLRDLWIAAKEKDKQSWEKMGITSKSIDSLYALHYKRAYTETVNLNSLEAYNHFLELYPKAPQKSEVVTLRNKSAFELAEQKNTWQVYDQYMKDYPMSLQYSVALERYENLLFYDLTKEHTLDAYKAFITSYPQSPFLRAAQDSLYKLSVSENAIETYEQYHGYEWAFHQCLVTKLLYVL
jgi:hypothetical protein